MARNFNAAVKFRYEPSENVTKLLVQFPGDSFYTLIATKAGKTDRAECNRIMEQVARNLSDKGYSVKIG